MCCSQTHSSKVISALKNSSIGSNCCFCISTARIPMELCSGENCLQSFSVMVYYKQISHCPARLYHPHCNSSGKLDLVANSGAFSSLKNAGYLLIEEQGEFYALGMRGEVCFLSSLKHIVFGCCIAMRNTCSLWGTSTTLGWLSYPCNDVVVFFSAAWCLINSWKLALFLTMVANLSQPIAPNKLIFLCTCFPQILLYTMESSAKIL